MERGTGNSEKPNTESFLECQAPPRRDLRLQLDQKGLGDFLILGLPKGRHSKLMLTKSMVTVILLLLAPKLAGF